MTRFNALALRLRRPVGTPALATFVPDGPLGDAWHVPPSWLDPVQDDLDEPSRRLLSIHVLAAIHSANAHGEARFVADARRLVAQSSTPLAVHVEHLALEETAHAAAFAAFATRACGGMHPDPVLRVPGPAGRQAPGPCPRRAGEDARLLGRLLVFEEIVDAIDLALARDAAVHPAVRAFHARHHEDEARHLAFGRAAVPRLVAASGDDGGSLASELSAFARASWRLFWTTEPFARAGLPLPVLARDATWARSGWAALRRDVGVQRLAGLARRGVLAGSPA